MFSNNFLVVKRGDDTVEEKRGDDTVGELGRPKSIRRQSSIRRQNIIDLEEGWNIYNSRLWDEQGDDSGEDKLPCLNCSLIQQGSAIAYSDDRCPQCGEDAGPLKPYV